jgi:hypothetical protein
MGFGPFRRNRPKRSLVRWFASPAPSALRVSHPLSGLIPLGPCGFVSRRFRPRVCTAFRALIRSTSRTASQRPLLSCRLASAGLHRSGGRCPCRASCRQRRHSEPGRHPARPRTPSRRHKHHPEVGRSRSHTSSERLAKPRGALRETSVMTASVRRERQLEQPRQQARAPASEPCSSRAAVRPKRAVSTSQSRCSPGLHPLRGLPTPPHGPKSSPHVVTAGQRPDRSQDARPRQPPKAEASHDRVWPTTGCQCGRAWKLLREQLQPP